MEGFYGDSIPDRKQYNPGYQVGTDFISSNLIKEIDFTTIYAYPDAWLSGQSDEEQIYGVRAEVDEKSLDRFKDPFEETDGFHRVWEIKRRSWFQHCIERRLLEYGVWQHLQFGKTRRNRWRLSWQILAQGMESYADGYEIVLSQSPSTSSIISQQSHQMTALQHMMSRP